jgi:hypothetical protein
MQIDLRLGGADAAVQGLGQVAAAFDKVSKSQSAAGGGGGSSTGGAGGSSRSSSSSTATRFLSGPNQRLAQIAEQMKAAQAEGNDAALADLKILQFRAERSKRIGEKRLAQGQEALDQPGLLDLFGDLNRIMRGLSSGNLHQTVRSLANGIDLIGDVGGMNISQKLATAVAGGANGGAVGGLQKLNGAAAALTPELLGVAAVAGGAVVGLSLLTNAVFSAAHRLAQVGAGMSASGGRSGDIFGLGAFGIGPGQAAGAGAGLRGRLAGDPMAQIAGAQLGIGPIGLPQAFGTQNNARTLRDALTALRDVTNAEEQLRLARMLGLESMVDELRVSDKVFAQRMRQSEIEENLFGEGTPFIQGSRDLQAELDITGKTFEDLKNAFATPFIQDAADQLRGFNAIMMSFGVTFQGLGAFLENVTVKFDPFLGQLYWLGKLLDQFGGKSDKQTAEEEHTKAMRDHTAAIAKASFGGGRRSAHALPVDDHGEMGRQALVGNAIRMGAILP